MNKELGKKKTSKELVLVTGGAGFIGSHLVDALLEVGYTVRVLDNLAPPTHNGKLPDWFKADARSALRPRGVGVKKFEFIKGDVRNKKDWEKALIGVRKVFHLAAYMDYHPDFSTYFDTNARSTALLYEVIVEKKLPVKKIIVASSQSLYGEGRYRCLKHGVFYAEPRPESRLRRHQWEVLCPKDRKPAKPMPELESDELRPAIPYGISKWASEKTAITLGKIYQIPSVALRYSIVQGSRQSFRHFYSGALRDFCVRALAGQSMIMQEDSRQIRDFVNVHDVVDAHLKVLNDPRADYQVFNVGSGSQTKVRDLAKMVCVIAGVKFRPVLPGLFRINAPRNSIMDVSKLRRLGWRPKRKLSESIQEFMEWVKNYPEAIKYLQKSLKDSEKKEILRK